MWSKVYCVKGLVTQIGVTGVDAAGGVETGGVASGVETIVGVPVVDGDVVVAGGTEPVKVFVGVFTHVKASA